MGNWWYDGHCFCLFVVVSCQGFFPLHRIQLYVSQHDQPCGQYAILGHWDPLCGPFLQWSYYSLSRGHSSLIRPVISSLWPYIFIWSLRSTSSLSPSPVNNFRLGNSYFAGWEESVFIDVKINILVSRWNIYSPIHILVDCFHSSEPLYEMPYSRFFSAPRLMWSIYSACMHRTLLALANSRIYRCT